MPVKNKVQLISYPDSLGGDLPALHEVLGGPLDGVAEGGIHILPPFPSSGDRGFAPLAYDRIAPEFGSWEDIQRLAARGPVMLDVMVNHMSRQAVPVQDYLAHGRRSAYADLFITPEKVWPHGPPPAADLAQLFLRRPSPFSRYRVQDTGEEVALWTTFGRQDPSEQVDLDWHSDAYRAFIANAFDVLQRHGVGLVRLDAVGYVVKKAGTSCFFVEPEIYEYLDWIRPVAERSGIELLPELHAAPAVQEALAAHGFWVYDFILPYAVLEALLTGRAGLLRQHLSRCPARQFTMLDCHDGIPVKPDLDGLYAAGTARRIVQACVDRGGNLSRILSPSHRDPDGFDVHQVRCTYYSALGENDDRCVAARALQLFTPGVPQVYYAGLLAARNDLEAVRQTGEGREINRHNYTRREIDAEVQRPVVQRLLKIVRFRNEYPAFDGTFRVLPGPDSQLGLRWERGSAACTLTVELANAQATLEYLDPQGRRVAQTI